jgi:glycosyltransferase involved in cell wall biosynthesis
MSTSGAPDLSLVLPCYNEAQHWERSVAEIIRVLEAARWTFELIFVDDASRDATPELIRSWAAERAQPRAVTLFHTANLGRGRCVSDGFRAARGEFVGYLDIDLEVAPHYIPPALLALRAGADVCVGRRLYQLNLRNLYRHILSRGYARLARLLLGWPYRDSEAGFKFFRRGAAQAILPYLTHAGWFWDTEVMFYAHRLRLQVVELPCLYQRRADKNSTVRPLRDSLDYAVNLARLAVRARPRRFAGWPQRPADHDDSQIGPPR